jgi:predicted nucleotidyltransferase
MTLVEQDEMLYQDIARRIVEVAGPDRIILFGSRARGDHRPTSDIDILVVQESSEPRHVRSRALYGATSHIPLSVGLDIMVYTPREVWEWSTAPHAFVTTALREGRVLYEK